MITLAQHRQQGFGLVEILVALVLGLLLSAAAIQAFLGNRASHQYNTNLASLQDNARFALHTLSNDLRQSGYSGCPQAISLAPILAERTDDSVYGDINLLSNDLADTDFNVNDLLSDAISQGGAGLPARAVAGNDSVRITYMRDYGVRAISTSSNQITLSANPARWGSQESADTLLVTDCSHADFFATDEANCGSAGTTLRLCDSLNSGQLTYAYDTSSRVLQPYQVVYYIGDTQRNDSAGEPVTALYRRELFPTATNSRELIANVSNLTLRYGEDVDGNGAPDAYVNAASVTDWTRVVALRLAFIVASEARADQEKADTQVLLDTSVSVADDGHLRRVFSTTVALRNRVQ